MNTHEPAQKHRPHWVLEARTHPKNHTQGNEDALVVENHVVAVIDGMSSPLRTSDEEATGGVFARRVAAAIRALPANVGASEAIERITASLSGIVTTHAGPAGAVAAIYSRQRGEIWRIGDVHVRIGEHVYPGSKRVDVAMAQFRAAVDAAHLAAGTPVEEIQAHDPGLRAASPLLEAQSALANSPSPWGYGVLNGHSVPASHIEVLDVPDGAEVVLASDGYLSAATTLQDAEDDLAAALATDPLCIGPLLDMGKAPLPGRMPDDRTYVRLRHGASPTTLPEGVLP